MCEKKFNNKKKNYNSSCCWTGMVEMMESNFPNGESNSDCFAWMKKMNEKFCCPESSDSTKEHNQDSCRWSCGCSFAK